MATARWSAPGTPSANLAGTALDGLATGSTSAFLTSYTNGTNLDLYAGLLINLGSITPTTGGSIIVRVFSSVNGAAPDNTAAIGGGDAYAIPLTTATGAKQVTWPMIRLYPGTIYIAITNNAGVALSSTAGSNTVVLVPFDEASN
jgi:hypothetical protein